MSVPKMRAQLLNDYADDTFKEVSVDRPVAGKGQVLVHIVASGVNPIDTKIRAGVAPYAMPELPAILGTDLAGVVEEVGEDVTTFKVGDEVYGLTGGVRGLQGSLAEYSAVDVNLLAIKPKNVSMREAAAIPLVFLTAWEGLVDRANVGAGQSVLVQGGAGEWGTRLSRSQLPGALKFLLLLRKVRLQSWSLMAQLPLTTTHHPSISTLPNTQRAWGSTSFTTRSAARASMILS